MKTPDLLDCLLEHDDALRRARIFYKHCLDALEQHRYVRISLKKSSANKQMTKRLEVTEVGISEWRQKIVFFPRVLADWNVAQLIPTGASNYFIRDPICPARKTIAKNDNKRFTNK